MFTALRMRPVACLLAFALPLASAEARQLPQRSPVVVPNPQQLPATATASSSGAAGGPSLAVDGNLATRWESAHGIDPSWIALDLGAPFALHRGLLRWEAANAATYRMEGSNDGVLWSTIANYSGGVFGERTDELPLAGVFRHVRMFGLTRSAGNAWGYSLWELELYGQPPSDGDGDGVDDSIDACPSTPANTLVDEQGCTLVITTNEVAHAGGVLVGSPSSIQPGFSLYVFDLDLATPGASACTGACEATWPPLQVTDGVASGVPGLSTIDRPDGTQQAAYLGRPLYFYSGDTGAGEQLGNGVNGEWWVVPFTPVLVPLFDRNTRLDPELQEDTSTALITRLGDRARDRHAREDEFQAYAHYLSHYWEHRTADIEIVDTVAKGGSTITFNVATQWKLSPLEAELRFFYRGFNTVAEYYNNGVMTSVPGLDIPGEDVRHYTRSVSFNQKAGAPLQIGDRLEFELSQFLDAVPSGRNNYYGTAILYVVGEGVVPWEARGTFGDPQSEREDSYPLPAEALLGGGGTLSYAYSDEPDNAFLQMATNLAPQNAQPFVRGRRVHHTDFGDGSHNESPDNPSFGDLAGQLGTRYVDRSCVACHDRNGRALPPPVGQPLRGYVVRVGESSGAPHPLLGSVLQPFSTTGAPEGGVVLSGWTVSAGLRTPTYSFSGPQPEAFSARLAPQLVGLGLLESVPEEFVQALADPDDLNGDGISGRIRLVTDPETGESRLGRFGWKSSQASLRHQIAAALNTDMGVMTSVRPEPDCGPLQSGCDPPVPELADAHLQDLTDYITLLGVNARRDLEDPETLAGEALFAAAACNTCHVETLPTSPFHPRAELRNQTIHAYTDLLLHDMGPGLASTLIEDDVSPSEWRTAPLWSLGLSAGVSAGEAYLHDGRARTLEEAILWHGGEGSTSRQAYEAFSSADKAALLAFLRAL